MIETRRLKNVVIFIQTISQFIIAFLNTITMSILYAI